MRYLLDRGVLPSPADAFGNTPLFEAVQNGFATVAFILREARLGLAWRALVWLGLAWLGLALLRDAALARC